MSEDLKNPVSRRNFLKIAGLVGVAAQTGGLVAAGVQGGRDSETYTGWESFNPGTQFFNRKPFEFDGPAHPPVGEVRRPSHMTDYVFGRVATFQSAYEKNPDWTLEDPIEDLGVPQPLVDFYKEFPERLEWDYKTFSETIPNNAVDRQQYGNYFLLAQIYESGFSGHSSLFKSPSAPPEVFDFAQTGSITPDNPEGRPLREPIPFNSPDLAAEFIKEVGHRYGATLVGITKTNPDWLYSEGWRGCPEDYDYSNMPAHWEYAIVIGVPMEWDAILGSPQFSTSGDAYDRVTTAAIRLEACLKYMGYPARAHTPNNGYDLIVPPHAVEAGLGEVGRTGYCITPELGGNCRMAVITTSLPMTIDRPIDYGVAEFCNKCKLCAESCPSGAISMADSPDGMVLRGYEHWYINNGACYNFWRETMGPMGCRMCVATCPYSRKDNWIHDVARELDPRDPTGLVSSGLLFLQKNFFDYPEAIEYKRPAEGGHFASYRPEPFWMQAHRYLDIDIVSPHEGA
ncbi:MAG: 4Fe-4S dicluster domain-containing protein [Anaerolineae bacterium]|nr:4Fe-4S dicluster domain-containing protein [Anaerolineae bacterium]